jgi:hypothetical protein
MNKGFKNNGKIALIFALIVYRCFLDFSYYYVIIKSYGYYGFYSNITVEKCFASVLLFLFFTGLIIKQVTSKEVGFSSTVIFLTNILVTIPFTTLVGAGMVPSGICILFTIYWIALIFFQNAINKKELKRIRFKMGNKLLTDKVAQIFGIVSLLVVLYISFRYTHFRLIFNIFDVYTFREEALTYDMPLVLSYAFSWTRALNTIFLSYSIIKKKRLLTVIYFVSQMLSFGIDGLKSTLFMPYVAIIVCLVFKDIDYIKTRTALIWGISGVTVLGVIEAILLKTNIIINVIVRRVLFIPAYLNVCYGKFFTENIPDYFRASFLRFFGVKTPYDNLGTIIGGKYFGKVSMNCNNGMFADAMTNFGIAGVIIMPIILVILLRFVDTCTINVNRKVFITTALYFSIVLSNSFVTTTFITHGLFVSCVVLLLMGSTNDDTISASITEQKQILEHQKENYE